MDSNNLQTVSGIEPLTDDSARQISGGCDRSLEFHLGYAVGYVASKAKDAGEWVAEQVS